MNATGPRSPRKDRLGTLLFILILVFLFVNSFVLHAFIQTLADPGPDWPIFLRAAEALSRGENPYSSDLLTRGPGQPDSVGWKDYIYPPLFARIVGALAQLGPFWSMKIYLFLCLLLYLWLFFPRWEDKWTGRTVFAAQFAILFSWGPVIQNFRHGQTDFFALFLFTVAWQFLRKGEQASPSTGQERWEWVAGLALGASFGIKLTPALVVPLFLAAGGTRIVGGFLASAVLSAFLPDPRISYDYFTHALPTMLSDLSVMERRPAFHLTVSNLLDQSLSGLFGIECPRRALSIIGIAASGATYAWILLAVFQRRRVLRFSDLLLVGSFLPPLFAANLRHHFALTLLPVLIGVRRVLEGIFSEPPEGEIQSPQRGNAAAKLRIAVLFMVLCPTFYYTLPVRTAEFLYGEFRAIPFNQILAIGQILALVVLWRDLLPVTYREGARPGLPVIDEGVTDARREPR